MKTTEAKREFITLEVSQIGFVVYGIGGGACHVQYRRKPLMDFLDTLWEKMRTLKDELNRQWCSLDRENSMNPKNTPIVRRFLEVGAWAYALAVELHPFQEACLDGPTNPLKRMFIDRLEEIFTKCFAAAHLYGPLDEAMVGVRGLLTDFECNGGIDHKTGGEGCGFGISILMYYMAYFAPTNREPIVYECFAEFIDALATLVAAQYQKVTESLADEIQGLMQSTTHGFGRKEVRSEAKTAMLRKLEKIAVALRESPEKLRHKAA